MSDEKTVVPHKVKIRNTARSGVSFRVPGQSIHLQPGHSVEIQAAYLDTAELEVLLRQGTVIELPSASASASSTQAGEKDPAEGQAERASKP